MKSSVSLVAGIIGAIAGLLLIGSKVGLFFTLDLIVTLAMAIVATALGSRAWQNKKTLGLIGAILGIITWVILLAVVFTKLILRH